VVVDILTEALATHHHLVAQGSRREAQREYAVGELDGRGETADKVAGKLTVDTLDTQLIGKIAVVQSPEGALQVVVECTVGLHGS
jgi:hypothetical protein